MELPTTHKALVLSSFKDPLDVSVQTVPTPQPSPGSAIIRVLSARAITHAIDMWAGRNPYPMTLPLTPGAGGVGRVVAVGTDATTLTPGQLVLIDFHVQARDDPSLTILQGFFGAGPAQKLMAGEWRNGTYAEYVKVPLENVFPLDEELLMKGLGYSVHDLAYILALAVPMGGFAQMDVKPGETVVVAPATGTFGSAAVTVALGLGARVVALGRNEVQLQRLEEILNKAYGGRLSCVKLSGSVDADAQAIQAASPGGKGVDAYFDVSPPEAANNTYIKSCLVALKPHGRGVFMGGIMEDVSIPYGLLMLKSLRLGGRLMYERDQVKQCINMVEAGLIKLGAEAGVEVAGVYGLEDAVDALKAAKANTGFGKEIFFKP